MSENMHVSPQEECGASTLYIPIYTNSSNCRIWKYNALGGRMFADGTALVRNAGHIEALTERL